MTNRELHIKEIFLPKQRSSKKEYLDEEKVDGIINFVSELGRSIGFVGLHVSLDNKKIEKRSHKFDVWVAKEIKKNINLIEKEQEFRLIIDWVIETKYDIFSISFENAMLLQQKWHNEQIKKFSISDIKDPKIDEDRILYRCADGEFFIYLLMPDDLKKEGASMKNCIGGNQYKVNLKAGTHFYVSLRDGFNNPHVSVSISVKDKKVRQILGKTNEKPKLKYLEKILEFVFFYTNYKEVSDVERTKIMNLKYLI